MIKKELESAGILPKDNISPEENHSRYYIHANIVTTERASSVSVLKNSSDGRIYEITLCPTISAAVFLTDDEAKRHMGNHHIFGTLQFNSDKDFDDFWNTVIEMLEKRKEYYPLKINKK